MAKCVFIVQGEGRGHMSQSIAVNEYLEQAGHSVEAVFVGCNYPRPVPQYYKDIFKEKLSCFFSPFFLRTPNQKGIYIGRTILFNLVRSVIYFSEVRRIRREINATDPDYVFNFYDIIGALALRKIDPKIIRIGIGHHFYLHHDGYKCNTGFRLDKWLLSLHTRKVMKSLDRVFAISYRPDEGSGKIHIIPPLIRRSFREIQPNPGIRYLVYLLNEGYIYDLISMSRADPDFKADVFTDLSPGIELPSGIHLHPLNEQKFRQKMGQCRGLITTSGFDTVAEAAYTGIPMIVIPVKNHFEQRCNGMDLERTGFGFMSDHLYPGILQEMKPYQNSSYRKWVERAGEMLLELMKK